MQTLRWPMRLPLAGLIIARLMLGLLFSLNTPLWESFDETGHYAYARYLSRHRALPPLGVKLVDFDETHQPPLYYALVALPMALVLGEEDLAPVFTAGGRTWVVPEPADRFPWHGTALALRLGRLASLLLGALGILFVHDAARALWPGRPRFALLAAALYAFWPQSVFLSGAISNDVGMIVIGAMALWAVARLVAVDRGAPYIRFVLGCGGAGIVAGLATWVKANGWFVALGAAVALLVVLVWRRVWAAGAAFSVGLLLTILLGALVSEGRTTAPVSSLIAPRVAAALAAPSAVESAGFLERLFHLLRRGWYISFESLFAGYSWGTLSPPDLWTNIAVGAALVSLAVSVRAVWRSHARAGRLTWLLVCFWFAIASAPILRAVAADEPSLLSGRFFLPALAVISLFVAYGAEHLPARRRQGWSAVILTGPAMVSLMSPWLVLQPAYRPPTALSLEEARARIEIPMNVVFGDAVRLLGYRTNTPHTEQGQAAAITAFWEVLRPTARGYGIQIDAFDIHGQSLQLRERRTPGNNTLPTWRWPAGLVFAETYEVTMRHGDFPMLIYFTVNFFDQVSGELLDWSCPASEGEACSNRLGRVAVSQSWPERWRRALAPATAEWEAGIALLGFSLPAQARCDGALEVRFEWRARRPVEQPYVMFVHVLDAQDGLVAQHDQPPRAGRYPTNVWRAGEVVPDSIVIESGKLNGLPAGRYAVQAGIYHAESGQRLPLVRTQLPAENHVLTLAEISLDGSGCMR
jgi:hypothetical protein